MPTPLVVHVVYRFAVGGLENGVVNLVNTLPRLSWRHAVLSLTDIDEGFANRIKRDDVELVALHKGPGHAFSLYPRLFEIFRKLKPAIVHTRNLAALEALVPAWAAGVQVRIHGEHGRELDDVDGSNVRKQWVRRAFAPFVTQYVALSRDLERYLRDRVGISRDRIEQIYNGVDTTRFSPSPEPPAIAGCPFNGSGLWLVGTVGRMQAVKAQPDLARAFIAAVRQYPQARARMRLVLAGEGPLELEVQSLLQQAGVQELAWLAGERADIPALLRGLSCFVLPSLAEGISNTILEAMACGLPIVATRVGGNVELIEDRVTGSLVPAADVDATAGAIVAYFNDPATARQHGKAGRQRVEERYSLECMVEHYHRLYSRLLCRKTAGASSARSDAPGERAKS